MGAFPDPAPGVICRLSAAEEIRSPPVRVQHIDRSGTGTQVTFSIEGDPVCAERREGFRCSAITAGVRTEIDGKSDFALEDVSENGLAIATQHVHAIGQLLHVRLVYGARQYQGDAQVRNTRRIWGGRVRYGLRAERLIHAKGDLLEGLRATQRAIQTAQS